MDFLGTPIGFLMDLIYGFVSNYGLTIIVLTIIFKLVLLPLTIKQQKSTQAMQAVQPLLAEIQKKYANEKERQSQEMLKLYKEYNINPAAGCLPTLIQFPILIGLYGAIAKPLKFMFGMTAEQIEKLCELVGLTSGGNSYYYQILAAKKAAAPEFLSKAQEICDNFRALDFNFLGIDLSATPKIGFLDWLWVLPILAALLTYLSSKMMQTPSSDAQSEGQKTAKYMMYFFPAMILYLGFTVPTGLSLYWVVNSLLQIVQYYVLDRKLKGKLAASVTAGMEEKKHQKRLKKKK